MQLNVDTKWCASYIYAFSLSLALILWTIIIINLCLSKHNSKLKIGVFSYMCAICNMQHDKILSECRFPSEITMFFLIKKIGTFWQSRGTFAKYFGFNCIVFLSASFYNLFVFPIPSQWIFLWTFSSEQYQIAFACSFWIFVLFSF